jgi:phosphoribosylaminoimidazole (AIR) synthetase
MKEFIQKIVKLIDVKSIMTLTLTIVFAVLVLRGNVTNEQFMTIFTMIVGFYFGVQSAKHS